MIDERLDKVLEDGREPDPSDDGFTDRVVTRVRDEGRTSWRRHLTRPVALAAAAVLVASGAAAAVRTVTTADVEVSTPRASADVSVSADASAEPALDPGAEAQRQRPPAGRPEPAPEPTERPPVKRGTVEYGYTSPHTAYAQDDSGLRLETETHTNQVAVRTRHNVTLTLSNTGEAPIGVYAPQRCPMTVAVFRTQQRTTTDTSDTADGEPTRDPSRARVWNCAGSGEDPNTAARGERQRFVLMPGESRVETAVVVFPEPGGWALIGRCECYWMTRTEPQPTDEPPSRPSPSPTLERPAPTETPPPDRSTYRSMNLYTPPIRVVSS